MAFQISYSVFASTSQRMTNCPRMGVIMVAWLIPC